MGKDKKDKSEKKDKKDKKEKRDKDAEGGGGGGGDKKQAKALTKEDEAWLAANPEVERLTASLLAAVLRERPADIAAFAATYCAQPAGGAGSGAAAAAPAAGGK